MAKTIFVGQDDTIEWENTLGSTRLAGTMQNLVGGTKVCYLLVDVDNGAKGAARISGGVEFTKVSGEAWTQGAVIYLNTSTGLTTTVGSNRVAGIAARAQASGDVLGRIFLNRA